MNLTSPWKVEAEYDDFGNRTHILIFFKDKLSSEVWYEYDSKNRIISSKTSREFTSSYAYNEDGSYEYSDSNNNKYTTRISK